MQNFVIEPTLNGYKVFSHSSELCNRLNRRLAYPYGRHNFVTSNSEGIFYVPKTIWPAVNRIINAYR